MAHHYTKFDFMGIRRFTYAFSIILSIAMIVSFLVQGLNLGIDFTSGTLVEVNYRQSVDLSAIRSTLSASDFEDAVVQYYGSAKELMIRIPPREGMNSAAISDELLGLLRQSAGGLDAQLHRVEFVGPQVGEELLDAGVLATVVTLIMILIYVAIRFQMRFSVGAIVATIHDVIVTVGFFSITRMEFNLTVLAAILAIIGYSLNDTIVVFDRIRENFHKLRKADPVEVINVSINQTLSRTLMTSIATMLVVIIMFFFGGETIHGFATALIVGIVIGTYSSIFVASPVTLELGVSRKDLMPVEREGAVPDNRP